VKSLCSRIWNEQQGVLTFEWVLLITLVVIGVIGGVSAVRDAMISEMGDVCGAMVAVDQSYTVVGSTCIPAPLGGRSFGFEDGQGQYLSQVWISRPAITPISPDSSAQTRGEPEEGEGVPN